MIMPRQYRVVLLSLVVLVAVQSIGAFQTLQGKTWESSLSRNQLQQRSISATACASTRAQENEKDVHFLMKDFTTASGEVVYVCV